MPGNPLLDTNNLSDVSDTAIARENLDVYDKEAVSNLLDTAISESLAYRQDTSLLVMDVRDKAKYLPTVREMVNNLDQTIDIGPYMIAAMKLGNAVLGGGGANYRSRVFSLQSAVQLPGNPLRGNGWADFIRYDSDTASMAMASGTVLENILISASLMPGGLDGIITMARVNRVTLNQIRINNATGNAFAFDVTQNTILRGCFVNYGTKHAYHIGGAENLVLDHCNSNQNSASATDGTQSNADSRGIWLGLSKDGTTKPRQVHILYGIFERGSGDYQVEITASSGISFYRTEINGGILASVKLSNADGSVTFDNVSFTRNQNDGMVVAAAPQAASYRVIGTLNVSGGGGRVPSSLFGGDPIFDEYPWRPFIKTNFSNGKLGGWSQRGSSASTLVQFDIPTKALYISTAVYNEGMQAQPYISGFEPSIDMTGRTGRLRIYCKKTGSQAPRVLALTTTQVSLSYNGASIDTTLKNGLNEFIFDLPAGLIGFRFTGTTDNLQREAWITDIECVWR